MKSRFILGMMAATLALWSSGQLYGQTVYSPSTLLQPLNDQGGSARAAAIGSAFVAVADDSSALLWNPAGLGTMKEGQIAIHHNSWLVDTLQETLVVGIPVKDLGGFAAMGSYLDYGSFAGRDLTGLPTADYSAAKLGFMLGWGKELIEGLSAGAAMRGTQMSAMNQTYELVSGDVGVLWNVSPRLRLGASLVDFGGTQNGSWVAAAIRMGASYKLKIDNTNELMVAMGGTIEPQGVNRLNAGFEYGFESTYFIRAGSQFSQQDSQIKGLQDFTAGGGIRLSDFQLDYAFLPYGDLGTSHRISLSYTFPKAKTTPTPMPTQTPTPAAPVTQEPEPPSSFKPELGTGTNKNPLTLQFDVPPDLVAQGHSLEAQGHQMESMRLYEEAILADKTDPSAWTALGMSYFKLKQKAKAIQCFEQVVKLRPDYKVLADWLEKYKAHP